MRQAHASPARPTWHSLGTKRGRPRRSGQAPARREDASASIFPSHTLAKDETRASAPVPGTRLRFVPCGHEGRRAMGCRFGRQEGRSAQPRTGPVGSAGLLGYQFSPRLVDTGGARYRAPQPPWARAHHPHRPLPHRPTRPAARPRRLPAPEGAATLCGRCLTRFPYELSTDPRFRARARACDRPRDVRGLIVERHLSPPGRSGAPSPT